MTFITGSSSLVKIPYGHKKTAHSKWTVFKLGSPKWLRGN